MPWNVFWKPCFIIDSSWLPVSCLQARYFKEQDIDEFRDCFYLKTASKGQINTVDELKTIMRSLGMSPTIPELDVYLKEKGLLTVLSYSWRGKELDKVLVIHLHTSSHECILFLPYLLTHILQDFISVSLIFFFCQMNDESFLSLIMICIFLVCHLQEENFPLPTSLMWCTRILRRKKYLKRSLMPSMHWIHARLDTFPLETWSTSWLNGESIWSPKKSRISWTKHMHLIVKALITMTWFESFALPSLITNKTESSLDLFVTVIFKETKHISKTFRPSIKVVSLIPWLIFVREESPYLLHH